MATRNLDDFQVCPHFYKGNLTHIETPAGTIRQEMTSEAVFSHKMWMATYNDVKCRSADVGKVVKWLAEEWVKAAN
jgi:hypothetical protein